MSSAAPAALSPPARSAATQIFDHSCTVLAVHIIWPLLSCVPTTCLYKAARKPLAAQGRLTQSDVIWLIFADDFTVCYYCCYVYIEHEMEQTGNLVTAADLLVPMPDILNKNAAAGAWGLCANAVALLSRWLLAGNPKRPGV